MYTATITPLGRSAIIARLDSEPTWKVSEVGGWLDGTAECFIEPKDRLWLREAAVTFDGPHGDMYCGRVRHYDEESHVLSCVGQHTDAMATEPTQGIFCETDLGVWEVAATKGSNQNISMQVQGIDGGTDIALVATWEPVTAYPANSVQRWRWDSGATQRIYVSFDWARGALSHDIELYPLTDGAFSNGELPRGGVVWTDPSSGFNGASGLIDLGSCRGVYFKLTNTNALADTNGTTYQTILYNVKIYAGGVAPRYSATDGLTALRAHDVVAALVAKVPSFSIHGSDLAEDLTVVEPFVAPGNAADQMAALLQIVDGAFWWEKREHQYPPWAVYKPRNVIKVIDIPAEDGTSVVWDASPADTTAMFSAVKVHYTDAHGVVRSHVAHDTDPSHYLVKIGRYYGGAYGPKWADDIDIGSGTLAIATQAAATFFAYTTVDSWTGTVELTGVSPFAAYFPPGAIVRCQTREWGRATARVRESAHSGLMRAVLTVDNTATASDMMARAVEGLNRARAFTKARAIKTKVGPNAKIRKQMKANLAAARARAKAAAKKRHQRHR